ncbi:MAG TPA: hypothetical protein VEX35_13065 [Allosphingosinicella sp.]|nr:hypothetical protein [Allosphingosinicella sp.]
MPYNDVATGVRLARESVFSERSNAVRATRMAECAGTLISVAQANPPIHIPERVMEASSRLYSLAVRLGATTGRTAADMARIRDETVAANRQLSQTQPRLYSGYLQKGFDGCYTGAIMTDDELINGPITFDSSPATLENRIVENSL